MIPPRFDFPNGRYDLSEDQAIRPSFSFLISDVDGAIDCTDLVMAPTAQANALTASLTLTDGALPGECVVTAGPLTQNAFGSGDAQLTLILTRTAQKWWTVSRSVSPPWTHPPSVILTSGDQIEVSEDAADRVDFFFSVADLEGVADCSGTTATVLGGALYFVVGD